MYKAAVPANILINPYLVEDPRLGTPPMQDPQYAVQAEPPDQMATLQVASLCGHRVIKHSHAPFPTCKGYAGASTVHAAIVWSAQASVLQP